MIKIQSDGCSGVGTSGTRQGAAAGGHAQANAGARSIACRACCKAAAAGPADSTAPCTLPCTPPGRACIATSSSPPSPPPRPLLLPLLPPAKPRIEWMVCSMRSRSASSVASTCTCVPSQVRTSLQVGTTHGSSHAWQPRSACSAGRGAAASARQAANIWPSKARLGSRGTHLAAQQVCFHLRRLAHGPAHQRIRVRGGSGTVRIPQLRTMLLL